MYIHISILSAQPWEHMYTYPELEYWESLGRTGANSVSCAVNSYGLGYCSRSVVCLGGGETAIQKEVNRTCRGTIVSGAQKIFQWGGRDGGKEWSEDLKIGELLMAMEGRKWSEDLKIGELLMAMEGRKWSEDLKIGELLTAIVAEGRFGLPYLLHHNLSHLQHPQKIKCIIIIM